MIVRIFGRSLQAAGVCLIVFSASTIMSGIALSQQGQSLLAPVASPSPSPAAGASSSPASSASPSPEGSAAPSPAVSGSPPPGNKTVFGDLAHLVYTATGPLSAQYVFPSDGFASRTIAIRFVVATQRNAGVELKVGDDVIPTTQLGMRVVDSKTGRTQYSYFGVVLQPGPNDVTITPLGLNGLRGPSQHAVIYGPGAPVVATTKLLTPLVADGRTASSLVVTALDRWGNPAGPGSVVRVSILEGSAQFVGNATVSATPNPLASPTPGATPSPGTDGPQYEAPLDVGGDVVIPLLPGLMPGPLKVHIVTGEVDEVKTFYISASLRKPFVTGLASLGAGSVPDAVDGNGQYDAGNATRERLALYATGAAGKNTALTVAYESQNELSPLSSYGPYVQDPNERPYLTYGDSSTTVSDTHSADHLYARLDSGKSSLMWGQFNADTGGTESVGTFHALVSGAKADVSVGSQSQAHLSAFTSRNNVAFASVTLPASGLSMLARPLEPNIVVGSDFLTLVALNRQTGAVVTETPLIRNVDYTIDYATGILRFINVPLPFDAYFDPQVVLIQYQYAGIGAQSRTTGARFDYGLGRNGTTQFTLGYVNDATGTQNFSLFQQTLSGKLSGGGWTISHATSSGYAPTAFGGVPQAGNHGNAYAVALDQRSGANTYSLNYQATGAGYADPFGGLSVPGFTSYRAAWARTLAQNGQLGVEFDGQTNSGFGNNSSQTAQKVSWRQSVSSKLALTLGVAHYAQHFAAFSSPAPASSAAPSAAPSAQPSTAPSAALALAAKPSPGPSAAPSAQPGASPSPAPTDVILPPTGTGSGSVMQAEAGAQYKPNAHLSFSLDRTENIGNSSFTNTTQPAETVGEIAYGFNNNKGKVFLRELLSDTATSSFAQSTSDLTLSAQGTRATEFGVEEATSPATTVSSEYVMDSLGTGTDIYSAIGVQQKFHFGKGFGGNLLVQSANASGPGASGFTVYGGTISYTGGNAFRAALAVQSRGGLGGGMTLSGGMAGALSPSVSVVGSVSEASAPGSFFADNRVSLAYRPSDNDQLVSLVGWNDTSGSGAASGTTGNVVSFEELYRLTPSTQIAGRYAFKLSGDGYYHAHASVLGVRARQRIGPRFDIGAEVDQLEAAGIAGARSNAFATELGYEIGNTARAAVGYNLSSGVNPALIGSPRRKGIYFTFTTVIDRIFGWGSH